jgi:cell division protein ZapE
VITLPATQAAPSHKSIRPESPTLHTLLLSNVPMMPPRLASEARRFTWLVDVLYDRRVKLIMSAEVAPEGLYTEGPLAHEFPRTASRLNEMQSKEFLDLDRRMVDTRLT